MPDRGLAARRSSRRGCLLLCVLLPAALAPAQPAHPDFTGEWRLNLAASSFDREPAPPTGRVLQIDHRDPVFVQTVLEDAETGDPGRPGKVRTLSYSTDGIGRASDVFTNPVRTLSRWDGSALVIRTEEKTGPSDAVFVDRYELAAAPGRRLTIRRRIEAGNMGGPQPVLNQVLTFDLVPLTAGVARADITPRVPMPQYGYANRRCGPVSMGTHDPLWAKVLVLASARSRVAIVTLDLGSIVSPRLNERVAKELDIPVLLLAASHTHSGPSFLPPAQGGEAYLAELEDKIFAAVRQARDTAEPARLRTGSGHAPLGYNRLVRREHGRARAVFDNLERVPYGPVDPEFQILEVTTGGAQGRSKALLVHYAVHAVVLGPANCHYSADYPGVLQASVEAAVPGTQAMFVQGGAGDINPLFLARKGIADEDFAQVSRMGELLAAEVLKSRAGLRQIEPASAAISARTGTLSFADRWEKDRAPHQIGIATVLIGRDIAIAATPGEPLHKLQTRWKAEADVAFPLFYGYTYSGAGAWPGYLPDLRSAAYGGYGADNATRVEPGAGEAILETHLKNLYGLKGMWRPAQGLP